MQQLSVEPLTVTLPIWVFTIQHLKITMLIPVLPYVGKLMLPEDTVSTIPSVQTML